MTAIVPLGFYYRHEDRMLRRLKWAVGIYFGIATGLLLVFVQGKGLVEATVVGLLGGLAFGWLWTAWMRYWSHRLAKRVHEGDLKIVGEPPASGDEPRFRLPCSWRRDGRTAVPGVIYLSRGLLRFIPHRRFRQKCPSIELDLSRLSLAAVPLEQGIVSRLIMGGDRRGMELAGADARYLFLVPETDETTRLVADVLRSLSEGTVRTVQS